MCEGRSAGKMGIAATEKWTTAVKGGRKNLISVQKREQKYFSAEALSRPTKGVVLSIQNEASSGNRHLTVVVGKNGDEKNRGEKSDVS